MYRVTGRSGKYYALEIESIESDAENIEAYTETGDPVIIVGDIYDLENFGINPDEEVELVTTDFL